MKHGMFLSLLFGVALSGCGDDDPAGTITSSYEIVSSAPSHSIGQDSTVALNLTVVRDDTVTLTAPQFRYSSSDTKIAVVSGAGIVTGLSGGTATIHVNSSSASIDIPVTVRPWPATSVQLSVLSGPWAVGVVAGTRLSTNLDTGTFYAFPADAASSRLKGIVTRTRTGGVIDTVFCNYCRTPPIIPPATVAVPRVQRVVRFRVLEPALARVSNANNPTLQASVDSSGWVTGLDTSSVGVHVVLEVPADNIADTVLLKLRLRPIDSLRTRPDSAFFPNDNGNNDTGQEWRIYPDADLESANVKQNTSIAFKVGVTLLSRVQRLPTADATTNPADASLTALKETRPIGGVDNYRERLPLVAWESAQTEFLTIDPGGQVTVPCASITTPCNAASQTARNAMVLTCNDLAGKIPNTRFAGFGTYTVPSCVPTRTIPMPGALCTTANAGNSADLTSTCTIWVRASITDQATSRVIQRLYRINVRR